MKKRLVYTTIVILLFGLILYVLRGPNISNSLKKLILPELEQITGKKFIAQKIYINIFPLFVEMKGVKAFDDNGDKIIEIDRVKGYVGLSGLLRKRIIITRLVIKEPDMHSYKKQLEEIIANVKKYMAEETKMPFKVVIKSVGIINAKIFFHELNYKLTFNGLGADIITSDTPRFIISSRNIRFNKEGLPELNFMLDAFFYLKNSLIELKKLKLVSFNSEIKTSGTLGTEQLTGSFQAEINLFIDSVKRIFGLKNSGDGKISAGGTIKFDGLKSGIGNVFVDLKIKGDMYLETLMELLHVKEKIAGHINLAGNLTGSLKDLHGEGNAELENGNLFDAIVDKLNCNVTYSGGIMRFINGRARLYNGTAAAEGMIRLPVVNYFSVKVKAKDVSSKGLFKLIGWDPMVPEGKTSGEFESSGSEFNPHGTFFYRSTSKGRDVLGRVKEINGEFNMKGNLLRFPNLVIATNKSSVSTVGEVDLSNKTLAFTGSGSSSDIEDFSSPYFTALSGPANFSHSVSGKLDDPVIEMQLASNRVTFFTKNLGIPDVLKNRAFNFDSVLGDVIYRKNLLTVKRLSARSSKEEFNASGNVYFPKAAVLFDLRQPDYDLNISAHNLRIEAVADIFQGGPPLAGHLTSADLGLYGKPEDLKISGDFHGKDVSIFDKYTVSNIDGGISFRKKEFSFNGLRLKRGSSVLTLNGRLSLDKRFAFIAEGQKINAADVILTRQRELLASKYKELFVENFFDTVSLADLKIKGDGSFENPNIELTGDIKSGAYRGRSLGKGDIHVTMNGKHLDMVAHLLDGKLSLKGYASLTEKLPWSARTELQPARYDFIIANFLKDVPDDLLLNLRGNVVANGDKDHVNAVATINKAHLYFYGTGFTNSSGIVIKLNDRRLTIGTAFMKSDAAEFTLSGNAFIGQKYDLLLEGSSSLAPLKALSKNIDIIKGNASFVFSVTGDWDNPKINGAMDVANGALGFKNIPYRLSSVSAYVYVDEDRIVLEKAAGKLSGGDVTISGTAYLQKFLIKRFSLESRMRSITTSVSKDFWVTFDGDLYYRGNLEAQTILGDIALKRAKYSERIEWKSWLLRARQTEKTKGELTKIDMTKLNVRVSGSNLLIDNNVARASMKMDILLRGTIGQPIVSGKVEAKDGIVYFRNNEFKILKSAVDFSDPNQIYPYFDIVAETRVRNYNIRLSLDGHIDQFNLSLSSDPQLSETDIFSLLTVGQLGKNLKGLEGGIGAGEATSFVTGKLQDVLEERLKTITGFDRVQIDPSVSKSTGTVSPRVTVAKRLMGDKLYVTYSSSVSTGEDQVWKLEYILGKNTSLVGVRDEQGGLGGDIKFRFEFK